MYVSRPYDRPPVSRALIRGMIRATPITIASWVGIVAVIWWIF
jgi:hypothetical protein